MSDTYRDKEGRECADLVWAPRTHIWRDRTISKEGGCGAPVFWKAAGYEKEIHAPTLAALRRKLVEEDKR